MSKRKRRSKMMRAAARAPYGWEDPIASKWTRAKQQRHNTRKLGTFGAASPMRTIVKDGKPVDQRRD
jgi:hypothetical protein